MRKKLLALACAILAMLVIHGCKLPSSIEVKGKTQLGLPLNPDKANVGEALEKKIKKALKSNDEITVLDCYETDNGSIMTFLIDYSVDLYKDKNFQVIGEYGDTYSGIWKGSFPSENKGTINFSSLNDYFYDFDFVGIEAYLYISGGGAFVVFDNSDPTPTVEITMVCTQTEGDDSAKSLLWEGEGDIRTGPSALNLQNSGYSGLFPPKADSSVEPIRLENLEPILNQRPFKFHFDYVVGATISTRDNGTYAPLKLEIILKLPMDLTAKTDGAYISFNDPDEERKDIFSRKSGDDSPLEWIKSCTMRMELTDRLFDGGTLYLDDGILLIEKELLGQTMVLSIDGSDLEYINKTKAYDPKMGIKFAVNKSIQIPWSIRASRVVFDADISAKFDI
jgi:hypothetical protein